MIILSALWLVGTASHAKATPSEESLYSPEYSDNSSARDALTGFIGTEIHASLLSDIADRSILAGTFGYAFRGGVQWRAWEFFIHAEHNLWVATELEAKVVTGAFNLGLGASWSYANGFIRTSAAVGPSILTFDTTLDDAGSVGFFVDLRPVGLRWQLDEHWLLGVDPLAFALVVPVLDGIPLVRVEYRSLGYVHWYF